MADLSTGSETLITFSPKEFRFRANLLRLGGALARGKPRASHEILPFTRVFATGEATRWMPYKGMRPCIATHGRSWTVADTSSVQMHEYKCTDSG